MDIYDHYYITNFRFSESDKEACVPTVTRLLELAVLVRGYGVLPLESEADREPRFLLKTALYLLIDGFDPAGIKQILENIALADIYTGSKLLESKLIIEGVSAIQQGENPKFIELKLNSILGEKFILSVNGRPM